MILVRAFAGILFAVFLTSTAQGGVKAYDLTIERTAVEITGSVVPAMTINGTIPGPVLRFTEGETARIRVHNRMDEETSIHWHGLLVPFGMDGVPYLNFPPIRPGEAFTYEFPLRQSGTYWYHSHSGLQEQIGVYGSIVIEPRHAHHRVDRDHVVLFSDWTDEPPHEVLRTLRRGSHWYALQKGSGQSLLGAARAGRLGEFARRELQRMPPMDISDIAYDRFLANGRPETMLKAEPGELVRLRLINGSSATYFHLQFSGGEMTIVAADGLDVVPVRVERLLIAVAETYDVLVRIPGPGSHELRATAQDGSSFASVRLGSGPLHSAPDMPRPDLYAGHGGHSSGRILALTPAGVMGMPDARVAAGDFDRPGMHMNGAQTMDHGDHEADHGTSRTTGKHGEALIEPSGHGGHTAPAVPEHAPTHNQRHGMDHSSHPAAVTEQGKGSPPPSGKRYGTRFGLLATDASGATDVAMDGGPERPWSPYDRLRSPSPTSFSPDRPVRELRLTLDGDMKRFVWMMNNTPLSPSDSITVREGEVARFILINRTMMHHPMHLHGHFFRVVNGQGDHAPLKHTVDVAPLSTTVIEFEATEVGDWFFHCHLLYHMESGMARVVHYEGFVPPPEVSAIRPQIVHNPWLFWGEADLLSNRTEGFLRLADTLNALTAEWEAGWQRVDRTEWEGALTWDRFVNGYFSLFAGAVVEGEGNDAEDLRGIAGLAYLLPLSIETRAWLDTDGEVRLMAEKELELTPRLSLTAEVEYDTREQWEESVGLSYLVSKSFSLTGGWHSEFGWGAGIRLSF
jgi:CopA family copper-resistance protein